jgi:signal transduction histidine kinase
MVEPTGNVEFSEMDASLSDAAASLAAMKRRRLAVSEGASEVIFAVDQGLRIQMISEACQARWGYSPDFLTQRNIIDIIHPSDTTIAATMLERAKGAGSAEGSLRVRHRSGMFVDSRWSMKWNSAKSQAVVVSLDQTQDHLQRNMLVQQSEHQKLLIESLPVALLTANADGTISGASRQLYELFPHIGDVLGKRLDDLLAGAARRPSWDEIRQAGQQPVELLLTADREDPLSLEVHAQELADSDRSSYLISFEDVSEKYEVERFRQELVSMVSHDLRTPLTSVSAVLEMLGIGAYGSISEEGVQAAAKAGWAASGLIQLINDLLDIERAKARRVHLEAETVNTNDLLSQVFSELEDQCYENGVELPTLNQPATHITVDGGRAKQALKAIMEVLVQCAQPQSPIRLLTRDVDAAHFDIFIGAAASKLAEPEFQQLGNVYDNRAAFERTGNPFTRLHIACADALLQLMGASLQVMNVQGAIGFVIRFQKARTLANV